jgi:hypothetical protein
MMSNVAVESRVKVGMVEDGEDARLVIGSL